MVGVILAGGLSRRMNGREKGQVWLRGEPMIAHVWRRLAPQVARVVINANGDPERFRELGVPVIPDGRPGHVGPLAGVEAVLLALPVPQIVTVSVDLPWLPEDLVVRLLAGIQDPDEPVWASSLGQVHPTVGVWPRAVLPRIQQALDRGEYRLMGWLAACAVGLVAFPRDAWGRDPFFNVNREEDRVQAEAWLAAC